MALAWLTSAEAACRLSDSAAESRRRDGISALHPLAAQRRLFVRNPKVGEVVERQQRSSTRLAPCLRLCEVRPHRVRLPRAIQEVPFLVRDDRPIESRPRALLLIAAGDRGDNASSQGASAL
jgi:hypothetical protein